MMKQITAETLVSLPLFMGMSEADASAVVSRYGLQYQWYTSGRAIVEEGAPVNPLLLVCSGRAKKETWAQGRRYKLTEVVESPAVLQAERVFGLSPRYSSTFHSYGGCAIIEVPKATVYQLLGDYEVFRINFVNALSSEIQRMSRLSMRPQGKTVEARICRLVEQVATFPTGMKDLSITMNQLASELSTTRLNVSEALHRLEDQNLVKVQRGHLVIPSLQLLQMNRA